MYALRRARIQQRLHRIRTDGDVNEEHSNNTRARHSAKHSSSADSNSDSPRPMQSRQDTPNHATRDVRHADNDARIMQYTEGVLRFNWSKYQGHACVGVEWKRADHGLEDLARVVRCVKGPVLAAICEKLASDYALWRHGLPDLLFVRESNSSLPQRGVSGSCGNSESSMRGASSRCTDRGGSSMAVDIDMSTVGFESSSRSGRGHATAVGPYACTLKHGIEVDDGHGSCEHEVVIDSDDCEVEATVSGKKNVCASERSARSNSASVGVDGYHGQGQDQGACEALLVEVKGTGDSLSNAQIAWIHVLMRAGAQLEVCHVTR
jgi:hypothetical protein